MHVTTTPFASIKTGLPGDLEGVDFAGVPFFWVFFGVFCVDFAGEDTIDVTSD